MTIFFFYEVYNQKNMIKELSLNVTLMQHYGLNILKGPTMLQLFLRGAEEQLMKSVLSDTLHHILHNQEQHM